MRLDYKAAERSNIGAVMFIAIVCVGLVLLGIASIIVALLGQPLALISAALAFGSVFVGLLLDGSLKRISSHLSEIREYLERSDTYKEWKEYKRSKAGDSERPAA